MKLQELYDYIVSEMTAEEALMKLLKGPLMSYENLKFDKDEKVNPELIITMAAFDLGWDMVIERSEDKEEIVRGMAVGTKEYLEGIFNKTKVKP